VCVASASSRTTPFMNRFEICSFSGWESFGHLKGEEELLLSRHFLQYVCPHGRSRGGFETLYAFSHNSQIE